MLLHGLKIFPIIRAFVEEYGFCMGKLLISQPRLSDAHNISVLILVIMIPSCFWDPGPTLQTSSSDQIAILPQWLGLVNADQPPG